MRINGLILAGGKGSRMGGRDKGGLSCGKQTFLERLIMELAKVAEPVWLSGTKPCGKEEWDCRRIPDEFPGCGPLGGLYSGLKQCDGELILTAACDMPFLKIELYAYLYEQLRQVEESRGEEGSQPYMGAVPVAEGQKHPLAAIYRRGIEAALKEQLLTGNYRLCDALAGERILYVDITGKPELQRMLFNVNTLSDYESACLRANEKGNADKGWCEWSD